MPAAGQISTSQAWLRALQASAAATADPERVLPRVVAELALRHGGAPALLGEAEAFSFRRLAERMNQVSRWALGIGVARGETVALVMGNRPEYFAIWLGLTQIGAVAALVNVNLEGKALAHCLAVAGATRALVAEPFCAAMQGALRHLAQPLEVWTHGAAGARRADLAIDEADGGPLPPTQACAKLGDRALCIFTSGTTGLPKAANVSHHRVVSWCAWFAGLCGMGAADRMYNCLPMHHSVGGVVAVGAALLNGGSVVIREKFSATRFWGDVADLDCTMFQYIGELCRYLVAAPPGLDEKRHKLRLALGNGMEAGVWREFAARFALPQILEFYASTEGNFSLYNVEGKVGAIGKVPPFLAARHPVALARFDHAAGAPWRGPDGFCAACGVDEAGEALGRIGGAAGQRFEGYTQGAESEKKVLRDAFAKGDAWMRSGDLMRRDSQGFYFFVDRVGDTFRWKGENVAAAEIAAALRACPGVRDAVVYGVAVPHADGKAGMALLEADGPLDLAALARHAQALPGYARPLFLRVVSAAPTTSTFKYPRGELAAQGFDPAKAAGGLYYFDRRRAAYAALDAGIHAAILSGALRF